MGGSRGGDRRTGHPPPPPPPEKSQKYRVSLQYWSGSPENHKTTEPAFNVGPSSAHQRNAILMAFRWRANDGPIKAVFGLSIPHQLQKNVIKFGPHLTKLSGSAYDAFTFAMW